MYASSGCGLPGIGPDPVTTMDLAQRAQGIPANFQYEVKDGQVPQVVINTRVYGSYNNHVVFAREALDEECKASFQSAGRTGRIRLSQRQLAR